jgi:hypothetical protein
MTQPTTNALSRIFSPTVLLYVFVIIKQFANGIYLGLSVEPPDGLELFYWLALLWIIGLWLRTDSRKRCFVWPYDLGLFLYIAGPILVPYYLIKTRGANGLLVILGFLGVSFGAGFVGIVLTEIIFGFRG